MVNLGRQTLGSQLLGRTKPLMLMLDLEAMKPDPWAWTMSTQSDLYRGPRSSALERPLKEEMLKIRQKLN